MKFDWRHPWVLVVVFCIALMLTACCKKEPAPVDSGKEMKVQWCIAKLHDTKNFSKDTVIACRLAVRASEIY